MKYLGYADVDGAFDGRLTECPWTNLYIAWAYVGYLKVHDEPIDSWLPRMTKCVKRATDAGYRVYLGLDCGRNDEMAKGETIRKILTAMKPFWQDVVAVDVADEPKWDKETAKAMLAKVRSIMVDLGLDSRPCGMTFTAQQSIEEDVITIPTYKPGLKPGDPVRHVGPDYVVLELYSKPENLGPVNNLEYVRANINKAVARLDPTQKVWFWVQGFDRNGAFLGEADLALLNWQTYKMARAKLHSDGKSLLDPLGFLVFNWARTTGPNRYGTKWYPALQAAHQRIWRDIVARGESV
jgi:hypothetical protein